MITICLAGDVMTGRGIDQILPTPGDPRLAERWVSDARDYVGLAERVNGPIPAPVPPAWPWGDALTVLDQLAPDLRIINLETSITARGAPAAKGVHYRMHPRNIDCLSAGRPDLCTLANNHVLDYGPIGLTDSLDSLASADLPALGAGLEIAAAERPVALSTRNRHRVVVVAAGATDSGIPTDWAATRSRPGIALLADLSSGTADRLAERARRSAGPADVVIVSIHWGVNWGYHVPHTHVRFAHRLIDAGVDLVFGHSAHHPMPIQIHRGKLILYGCGDLIDDYEGISGHRRYRPELRLLYLPTLDPDRGDVTALRCVPLRARRMRLHRTGHRDTAWLRDLLARLSGREVRVDSDGLLSVPCR